MSEIWKTIKEYNGDYEVSNYGNVRTNIGTTPRLLKPYFLDGYAFVHLRGKNIRIHRLVAAAFIENPNNYECVNHKDYNRLNNHVENLEWCTKKYNAIYSRTRFIKPHASTRTLKYIRQTKSNTYQVQIRSRKGIYFNKTFGDVGTAIRERDLFLESVGYV